MSIAFLSLILSLPPQAPPVRTFTVDPFTVSHRRRPSDLGPEWQWSEETKTWYRYVQEPQPIFRPQPIFQPQMVFQPQQSMRCGPSG